MNAGRQILKWIVVFMLSFTTFNLFLSGEVESKIEIEASPETVYNQIVNLQNWQNWAIWWKEDTTLTTSFFSDSVIGEGSSMTWRGVKYNGSLKIIDCIDNKLIRYEVFLGNDSTMSSYAIWEFEEVDNGTYVSWRFQEKLPFFIRFMSFFVVPDLDLGLQNLKELCEEDGRI